ncbi:MAG: zinc ABC transporter substrate-binding protein [Ectothiorhodospiraceae bacterium]|nr:zinc ABC transporter substrate-binding protein [Chromatiales bacterium]MCP5154343.1 zinc ABC transporter substrate-binding protein [Ectothiorhodospiraceae bacterium]
MNLAPSLAGHSLLRWLRARARRSLATAGCLLAVVASRPAVADAPAVVASIAPVHSLVAAVMDGVGAPTLLMPAGASPHSYALRPSESRAIEHARVVFWVGPRLEIALARALAAGGDGRVDVALMEAEGVRPWPAREGGVWQAHGHAAEDHDHAGGAPDPHIWLDPDHARAMVAAVARVLADVDPGNGPRYRSNVMRLEARIEALRREVVEILAPVRDVPYVVFHDAYQGFERSFGMRAVGAVTVAPGRTPGARRVTEIRERIVTLGARCVFTEPQFAPRLVGTLVEGTGARVGVLDPVGVALEPGPELWFELMRGLAGALRACL